MEFIGMVYGVAVAILSGARNVALSIHGDSLSALCWINEKKFRSPKIRKAATAMVAMSIEFGVQVVEVVHVPGIKNVDCDRLSRGSAPLTESLKNNMLITDNEMWLNDLLFLCDPTSELISENDFHNFMLSIRLWLKRI
jgi:hypothetical protein